MTDGKREKKSSKMKPVAKKVWHFLWEDESLLSYIVFIVIAFVVLRFMAFPAFLYVSGYTEVAAVVSPSMVHDKEIEHSFYRWLEFNNISYEGWPFMDGLNVGDVIFVKRVDAEEIKVGDIILFYAQKMQIIHRVVEIKEEQGNFYYTTKGDANFAVMNWEENIPYELVRGKLVSKVLYMGYPRVALNYIIPSRG